MIKTVSASKTHRGLTFRDHDLAHELLDDLKGIELGAAAHNPFNLPGSINVAPADDFEFYKEGQVELCGSYAEIDVDAEAHALPFDDNSQDYVISSHVLEHLPDPVAALTEWWRVVRDGGYIFMIVPQRDALPEDVGRPLTTFDDIIECQGATVDTWDYEAKPVPGGRRGHYHVYSPDRLTEIIDNLVQMEQFYLEMVNHQDPDQKVGNGFCLVYQVSKPKPKRTTRRKKGAEAE